MTVPSKWRIAQHWATSPDRSTFAPRMYDLGEPCCFACGYYSEHWDKDTARASWERATLERAHIIPASLGGSDDASNLLLLCTACHEDSPDWPDPSAMARWIASRPSRRSQEFEEREAWMQAAEQVPGFAGFLASVEHKGPDHMAGLLMESAKRAGFHWGVGISLGTRAAILRDVVERAQADRTLTGV